MWLGVAHEAQRVVDAGRQFFGIVGHHDECFVFSLAEGFNHVFSQLTVVVVESVKGFVQYEQVGVFDKGACQ